MRAVLISAVVLAAATALPAQGPPAKLFKSEVDLLLHALRQTARPNGALADGSCLQTAIVLAAAGNSHRFYYAGDGPWLRNAVRYLFQHRAADGSFADPGGDAVLTTRWVAGALAVMGPEEYADDLQRARMFLRAQRAPTDAPLAERAAALRTRATATEPLVMLRQAGAPAAQLLRGGPPRGKNHELDVGAAVAALRTLVACQVAARTPHASKPPAPPAPPTPPHWLPAQHKGLAYLEKRQQNGVFSFATPRGAYADAGLTGLGLAALQTEPRALRTKARQRVIDAGLTWLLEQQDAKGFFGQRNLNYTTCAAVMALSMAPGRRHAAALRKAQEFILSIQNTEDRGYVRGDRDYGSIGYGGDERGDLSNLQFALGALRESGLSDEHEAFQKALTFLQRTQNLVEVNDFHGRIRDPDSGDWRTVAPGNDGGAAYYPGSSPAGYLELANGTRVPRSYGSMTYALLKAYTLCGLPADDPRVRAAVRWIGEHWQLDVNPGSDPRLPAKTRYQGLFYYYMVIAQALDIAGLAQLETWRGEGTTKRKVMVDWRRELAAQLTKLQRADGSWVNERNGRWFESQALICTCYAMLALDRCRNR